MVIWRRKRPFPSLEVVRQDAVEAIARAGVHGHTVHFT